MSTQSLKDHHDFSVRPIDNLEDLMACDKAKTAALSVLKHAGTPPKLFLTGPAGSGKSTVINGICKLAACEYPSNDRACGGCDGCRDFRKWGMKRSTGIFADLEAGDRRPFHYLPLNCRNMTRARIHDEIEVIRDRDHGLRIIHLEEAGSLNRDRCDESITDLMDDPDFNSCRWFASAVSDIGLDAQFRRRWNLKVTTSRPPDFEVAKLLARYCRQLGIDLDGPKTLMLLAEQAWGIVGLATALLPVALVQDPHRLTKQMVVEYPFPSEDPWNQEFFER